MRCPVGSRMATHAMLPVDDWLGGSRGQRHPEQLETRSASTTRLNCCRYPGRDKSRWARGVTLNRDAGNIKEAWICCWSARQACFGPADTKRFWKNSPPDVFGYRARPTGELCCASTVHMYMLRTCTTHSPKGTENQVSLSSVRHDCCRFRASHPSFSWAPKCSGYNLSL